MHDRGHLRRYRRQQLLWARGGGLHGLDRLLLRHDKALCELHGIGLNASDRDDLPGLAVHQRWFQPLLLQRPLRHHQRDEEPVLIAFARTASQLAAPACVEPTLPVT